MGTTRPKEPNRPFPWEAPGVMSRIADMLAAIPPAQVTRPLPEGLDFEALRKADLGLFGFHPRHGLTHGDHLPFAAKFLEPVSSKGLAIFLGRNAYHDAATSEARTRAFAAALIDAANCLRYVEEPPISLPLDIAPGSLSVEKEVGTGLRQRGKRGSIDLLLTWETPAGKPVALAVEFKHWAGLSVDQLRPYSQYLRQEYPDAEVASFYVTPDGHAASGATSRAWRAVSWFHLLRRFETYLADQPARPLRADLDPFDLFRRQQWRIALGLR